MLDEPFAALDADGAALAAALVREAMDRGCAVLASAHSASALEELGFAVLTLRRGKLVATEAAAVRRGRRARRWPASFVRGVARRS